MEKQLSALPQEGNGAPHFELAASTGGRVRLSDFAGRTVVLYFYPKDSTPGCTVEAKGFRDTAEEFERAGAVVLGVSSDSIESHCKFAEKFGLNFMLLSDAEHEAAERYGVWVEKSMYGKKYWGINRATFLIGPSGAVERVWPKVRPEGHAEEVLAAVRKLATGR